MGDHQETIDNLDYSILLDYSEIIFLFEFLAALTGILSLKKCREKPTRYFVFFLCLIFAVELVGHYSLFLDHQAFAFLKETRFVKNHWLFNPYIIINFFFYTLFFVFYIRSKRIKKLIKSLLIFYLVSSIANIFIADILFSKLSTYSFVSGSILLLFTVLYYFYEIIQDDQILTFKTSFTFYVAIGALVFHLCVTPLFIYSIYFDEKHNPLFVKIYLTTLTLTNIFMYTCYIFGFIVCLKKNKSYS